MRVPGQESRVAQEKAKNDSRPASDHATYIPFRRPRLPPSKRDGPPHGAKTHKETGALPLASETRACTFWRGSPGTALAFPWRINHAVARDLEQFSHVLRSDPRPLRADFILRTTGSQTKAKSSETGSPTGSDWGGGPAFWGGNWKEKHPLGWM